ncbi:MAG: NrfD/PsrC family molybdoenzyme membrane anchor subunit, partial [Bacillota bacterium]
MKATRTVLYGVWAAVFALGVYGLFGRFTGGHELAGYGSYVPWGLWVAAYLYFVGLAAGAFLLAALVQTLRLESLKSVVPTALYTALSSLVVGIAAIGLDLGRMGRAINVFTSPRFTSVMTWLVWLYTALFVLMVAIALHTRAGRTGTVKTLYTIGLPLSVILPGAGGALFAALPANPYWHQPLYPILFIVGAALSGVGLVTALTAWMAPIRTAALRPLGRALLALMATYVLLEVAEYSIPLWYGVRPEGEALLQVLTGPHAWVFWGVHVALGLVIPAFLLWSRPGSASSVGWAGALAAVGFFAVRLNIVIPGQLTPGVPGLETAFFDPRLTFSYTPTSNEWFV